MNETSLTVVSADRVILSANAAYLAHLGRTSSDVLGHDYLPWIDARDREMSVRQFTRAMDNFEPMGWTTRVVRPDGIVFLERATVLPLRTSNSASVLLATCQSIAPLNRKATDRTLRSDSVAEYVEDMAAGLARMASQVGLVDLGRSLDQVAAYAAGVAARIEREDGDGVLN